MGLEGAEDALDQATEAGAGGRGGSVRWVESVMGVTSGGYGGRCRVDNAGLGLLIEVYHRLGSRDDEGLVAHHHQAVP
jgi:hypothetical protein